jgi:hypothetical protein
MVVQAALDIDVPASMWQRKGKVIDVVDDPLCDERILHGCFVFGYVEKIDDIGRASSALR